MKLSDLKETTRLIFGMVNTDSIIEIIAELPDETDYSLAISIVSNYIAKEVRGNAKLSEMYATKAYSIEKMLEQYAFEVLIDNGYVPVRILNKFKSKVIMVIKTNNPVAKTESFFRPVAIPENDVYTQRYKGYKLHETTNSLDVRSMQHMKSNRLLEIKSVPDELLEVYRDLLTQEMYDPKSGEELPEYHKRLDAMVSEVKELGSLQFHNFNKQSGARNYSLMRYITGNKFIASLVQNSEYRTISKADIKLLKWWLYVNLFGKVILSEFRSPMFSVKDAEKALKTIEAKIVSRDISIKKFGEYLRIKEALTVVKGGIGFETKFVPDFDQVNCGLVSLANSFRRKDSKLLNIANLDVNETEIKDSHTEFQKMLGLETRDDAKKFDTPLLHGSALSTAGKAVNVELPELIKMLEGKLGSDYSIPNIVASIGREYFKTVSDTIKIGHTEIKSYSTKTNVLVEYGAYKFTVVRDMPTLRGLPTNHIGENAKGVKSAKVNSLYAK